jgi:hypothetical protein
MRPTYALLAGCAACACAASTASAAPLDGPVDIRDVKVLRPTQGSERGSLVVWVRAHHSGVTDAHRNRAVAGATHRGKVRVRIPGLGKRTATHELDLRSGGRGYTVRFRNAPKPTARIAVQVSAVQSLDLNGDGQPEQVTRDTANRPNTTPTAIPQTIAPPNGTYGIQFEVLANGFDVKNGEVAVFWASNDVGCSNDVTSWAPIDPQTGEFSFDHKGVKASGTFATNTSARVDVSWEGTIGANGPACRGSLPPGMQYAYYSPS